MGDRGFPQGCRWQAAALSYLNDLSVDPAESVCQIVATQGHDDHIAIIDTMRRSFHPVDTHTILSSETDE